MRLVCGSTAIRARWSLVVGCLLAAAPAQGPAYRDRWRDLQLELLREQLLHECQGRDQATLQVVADLVAATDSAAPNRPVVRALAHLRGVDADDAFVLRACLGAFVLPEVVDPAADREDCRSLHVSVQMPYTMTVPGAIAFELEVFDAAGARLHRSSFGKDAAPEDLRMAYTTVAVPGNEFADGSYRVRLSTRLDDAPPRAHDLVLEHRFHVLRGYETRAAGVHADAVLAAAKLGPRERAGLAGVVGEVDRAFTGEPFAGASDALVDLERAEQVLANVAAGRAPLDGLHGAVALGLPTGGETRLDAIVALPEAEAAAARRPLVVAIAATPALDVDGRRPMAPEIRAPGWLRRRVGDFGLGPAVHMAWLQSPGAGLPFARSLPAALDALRDLLPTDGRLVLVLELEAAVALCYAPEILQRTSGVVLIGGGVLALPQLRALGDLPMLGVTLTGHRSGRGLEFMAALSRGEQGVVDWPCRFTLLPATPRPWVFGAAAATREIADFVRALPPPK